MKKILNYPIIDIHTHLRDKVSLHTKFAKEAGISTLVFMPNTTPCLDNLDVINKYCKQKHYVNILPTCAITLNRDGKKLVDIDAIKNHVVGFTDDGNCLMNLKIVSEVFKKNVLFMAHMEPEVEMTKKYLDILKLIGGKLHIQHVSQKETVVLIKRAKKAGLNVTCETCPHYFTYDNISEDKAVNPPLGNSDDILAIKKGLADGTIDIISSDYAPVPRPKNTGFASFRSFIPLCYGLILDGTLTQKQLKEKLYLNPLKLINSNHNFIK